MKIYCRSQKRNGPCQYFSLWLTCVLSVQEPLGRGVDPGPLVVTVEDRTGAIIVIETRKPVSAAEVNHPDRAGVEVNQDVLVLDVAMEDLQQPMRSR